MVTFLKQKVKAIPVTPVITERQGTDEIILLELMVNFSEENSHLILLAGQ